MKRLFLLLLLALPLAAVAFAAPADSLARRMALLAARGDADRLRPLYVRSADSLPPYTRLYCQMALARADRRYGRMVACIDTLLDKYPRRLGTNGRFALVELKAGGLRRLGRYDELATFCRRELKSYRRKRFDRERLGRLVVYERLARRLGGATPRARLLSLADRDSVFTLREEYPRLSAAADTFARRRAALSLALAFRRDADALRLADSLLVHHADSLIDEDFAHVAHARARLLVRAGRWAELSALARDMRHFSMLVKNSRYIPMETMVMENLGLTLKIIKSLFTVYVDVTPIERKEILGNMVDFVRKCGRDADIASISAILSKHSEYLASVVRKDGLTDKTADSIIELLTLSRAHGFEPDTKELQDAIYPYYDGEKKAGCDDVLLRSASVTLNFK